MATDWKEIEQAAREQVHGDLQRLEQTPLEFGAFIAWSDNLMGRTNGFSPVHSVGFPQMGSVYTTCGELIPPPIRWLPLSALLAISMKHCQFCRAEVARIARENAA